MSKITAIIIGDKSENTSLIAELFNLQDIQVVGIGFDGNGAIRLAKEKNPDAIFWEFNLSEKEEIVVLQEIKQISPFTKVIAVTGKKLDSFQKNIISKKADFILYKPFDIEKLIQILTTMQIQMSKHTKH